MKYQINPSATLLFKDAEEKIIVRFLLDGSRKLYEFEVSDMGRTILIHL